MKKQKHAKHLKGEKIRRQELCENKYGPDYIYSEPNDIYKKYKSAYQYAYLRPFKYQDCKPHQVQKKMDASGRYYQEIYNKHQCEKVQGHWNPYSLNRENLIDEGVCWIRHSDQYCATKYQDKYVLQIGKNKANPDSIYGDVNGNRAKCNSDPLCEWNPGTYDCYSIESQDAKPEGIPKLPSSWPNDITNANIQSFLQKYYIKALDQKPQRYMPVMGQGNRCLAGQTLQISQPQTVVNMIMKGIARSPSNRGLLVWHSTGSGKCHGRDTPIIMYDGTIKMVQDVIIGDLLMGDDSTPRRVLTLARGEDELYDIVQDHGDTYCVNGEHILCLKDETNSFIHEITVNELLEHPELINTLQGYKVSVDFLYKPITDDPYEIGKQLYNIPREYVINSRDIRLKVLRGILEKAGSCEGDSYIINECCKETIKTILFLARSLGFDAMEKTNNRIAIPVKLSSRRSNIIIKRKGRGTYYGFTLDGNNRYLLGDFTVTHNTCTAAAVMESYWDSDKNIIFASSVEAIASNPPDNFIECAVRLLPRFKRNATKPFNEQMNLARVEFAKRNIKFMTFAQLAHFILIANPLKVAKEKEDYHKNYLKNAILIIDEVQNIFKPLPTQKKEHDALKKFLSDYKNPHASNLQLVILSATPGETPQEVVDLLNMIRDRSAPLIKVPDFSKHDQVSNFAKSVRGLVSFFEISSDMTKYPKVIHEPPYVLPMSVTQYKKYVESFKDMKADDTKFDRLMEQDKVENFYRGPRKYSNMLYNFEEDIELFEFSSKIPALLEIIKKYPRDKHFIYSTFFENRGYGGHGVLAIAKILEKELKYQKIDFKEARSLNKANALPHKHLRYAMAITNELTSKDHSIGENLKELTSLYNRPENKHGEYVHIFIASQRFHEGTDYKAIGHVHIFEPLLSNNKEIQLVGRAARYCSFKDFDDTKLWRVRVHKYLADFPVEAKSWNIEQMKKVIDTFKEELKEREDQLIAIKGKKGPEFKKLREDLKNDIAGIKEQLTKAKKEFKEFDYLDPSKIEMADIKVTKEVQERLKDLLMLNKILKETSVDCKLFKEFHAQSGQKYKCLED